MGRFRLFARIHVNMETEPLYLGQWQFRRLPRATSHNRGRGDPQVASERNAQQNLVTSRTLCAKEPRPSLPAGLDIIGPKPVCEEYSTHSRLSKEVRTGFVSIALIDISIRSMYDLPQSRREKRNRNWYIGDIATVSGPSREYKQLNGIKKQNPC